MLKENGTQWNRGVKIDNRISRHLGLGSGTKVGMICNTRRSEHHNETEY